MASGANVFQFSRWLALNAWNGSEVMLLEGGSECRLITLRPNSRSGWIAHEISISPGRAHVRETESPSRPITQVGTRTGSFLDGNHLRNAHGGHGDVTG